MLERFVNKHLGIHSRAGQVVGWYGERVVRAAFETVFVGKPNLKTFAEKPKIGGLTESQALERLKVFQESPGLQGELQDLLAHTIKGQ